MSQKVSRKSATAVSEEKEKRHSPVKEMKKKMAANAEKEKQAAEKALDKNAEKTVEKPTEKTEKPAEKAADKVAEKADKQEKNEKGDKKTDKVDKSADKKSEKQSKEEQKKPEPQPEKNKADKSESSKEDKSGKPSEKPDPKKAEPSKAKQNGRDRVHNGVSDVTLGTNGTDDVLNGTVKATRTPETPRPASDKQPDKDADDPKDKVLKLKEDANTVTDRRLRSSNSPKPQEGKKEKLLESPKKSDLEKVEEKDEDAAKSEKSQDVEVVLVEPAANEGEEAADKERCKTDTNYSKSRVKVSPYRRSMRLADQTNTSLQANYTGTFVFNCRTSRLKALSHRYNLSKSRVKVSPYRRSMRLADQTNTSLQANYTGTFVFNCRTSRLKALSHRYNLSKSRVKVSPYRRSMRLADQTNTSLQANYTGTFVFNCRTSRLKALSHRYNLSKSRVKVSPYRRSMRLADQTNTSLQANYTGNNTTMEMDITESSSFMEDAGLDDSSYLRGLRSIRGRSSYKQLKEITLRHVANKSARSAASTSLTSPATESQNRPTGTVVGRKRKPETDDVELGVEVTEREPSHVATKRMRVLERLAEPFRRVAAAAHAPSMARRNAEIVGINTDLPLSAPVASADTFDPETLKAAPLSTPALAPSAEPVAVPLLSEDKDNKRCVIM
ncbi:hypothetical protein PYW07_010288 [Mythimna separata]|uniref:Uncharacterized protein n=1 Tax=Mythimna separata TaxID=271217 RepID=A0AAD7YIR9_MYTSE|nr:hypothetical protein PYW07_010288 [Mythimna separata]